MEWRVIPTAAVPPCALLADTVYAQGPSSSSTAAAAAALLACAMGGSSNTFGQPPKSKSTTSRNLCSGIRSQATAANGDYNPHCFSSWRPTSMQDTVSHVLQLLGGNNQGPRDAITGTPVRWQAELHQDNDQCPKAPIRGRPPVAIIPVVAACHACYACCAHTLLG